MCLFKFWFPQGMCLVVGLLGHIAVLFQRNLHTILLIYGCINLLTHHFYCQQLSLSSFKVFFFLNLILFSDSCVCVCVCTHACLSIFQWVDIWIFFGLDNLSLFCCLWKLWWGGSHACDCAYYIPDSKDPNNASWLMTQCVLAQ